MDKLSNAVISGDIETVRLLLDEGADVNAININGTRAMFGTTALMWSAYQGHTEIVKLLLAKGADKDAKDRYGWTALAFATEGRHPEIIELLNKQVIPPPSGGMKKEEK
jgi:ankyrin repeat protein